MPSSIPSSQQTPPQQRVVRLTTPPRAVTWRIWPLVDGGPKAWLWLALIGGLGWLSAWMMQNTLWGVAVGAALTCSVWRLFVPTAFELNPEGVEQRVLGRWQRSPWRRFVRWESYPDGMYLFVAQQRTASDLFDGIYLPLPGTRKRLREKALAAVEYYLGPPTPPTNAS
jgi:hypothetical protein